MGLSSARPCRRRCLATRILLLALLTSHTSAEHTELSVDNEFDIDAEYEHTAVQQSEYQPLDLSLLDDAEGELEDEDHQPSAFLELHADLASEMDLDLGMDMDLDSEMEAPDQTQHLESLLALQDKYTAGRSTAAPLPEAEEDMPLEHDHLLVETHQAQQAQQASESSVGGGVGLSVGASAEVEAAIAALRGLHATQDLVGQG
jgi:hypothetical protein